MSCAPIALFVYKRLNHLNKTLDALARNPEAKHSELYVFSDAARHESDKTTVDEVREYLKNISGFASVHIIERQDNYGLSRSIIDGVTQVCMLRGRVIVLEDDMVTSPYFLRYMNDSLDLYEADNDVISIHGYVYPVEGLLPETFFIRGADCWGWATWQRGWALFEPDGERLLLQLKERRLCREFDLDGAYPYTSMLKAQITGRNDSWAIRWYASAFLNDKLTLYPGRSLVSNIGNDSSGTHCGTSEDFSGKVSDVAVRVEHQAPEENEMARKRIITFLKDVRPSFSKRVWQRLAALVTAKY
jgi:hypothetical protein